LADHLDRDELDRLVGAGAVAVGLLVLATEGFLEVVKVDRALGKRHGELVGLPLVVERRRAPQLPLFFSEPLGLELPRGLVCELVPGAPDLARIRFAQKPPQGARVVVLDVGVEQTKG
jgi:hypothetical protein